MSRFDKAMPDSTPASPAGRPAPILRRLGLLGAVLLLGLLLVPMSARANSKDVAKGKKIYTGTDCVSCHGKTGREVLLPDYPIIAGQTVDYVYLSLHDYKAGNRIGAEATGSGMVIACKKLTDEQLHLLADYIATLK